MSIYTILEYCYGEVTLKMATVNKNEAINKFNEDPRKEGHYYSLQVWKDERKLMEIFYNDRYKVDYASYLFEDDKRVCNEILEQLK